MRNTLAATPAILVVAAFVGSSLHEVAAQNPPPSAKEGGAMEQAANKLLSLDELLRDYRALGLPSPPKAARLVRYEISPGYTFEGKAYPISYGLAFVVKPGTESERALLFAGVREWRPKWHDPHCQPVEPEPAMVKGLLCSEFGWPDGQDQLLFALQCHERGWEKLAQYFLDKSRKAAQEQANSSSQQLLAYASWYFWEDHLTNPKIDRAPAAKYLKVAMKLGPELDCAQYRSLVKSLDLALVPSTAKAGSIRALIDDLVDYNTDTGSEIGDSDPEDRFWRLARLGLQAVPELIEHLEDERLTRARMIGFKNFRTWNLRVQHVVSDVLDVLAGHHIGRDWLRRQQGYPVKKADAKKWLEVAQKIGEETYLVENVLPVDVSQTAHYWMNAHLLKLIEEKYPKHIPSIYQKILEKRPEVDSEWLAAAVMRSKLSAKVKLDLFLTAAKHKDRSHRAVALSAINELDTKQFNSLLLAEIVKNPMDAPWFVYLAISSGDAKVWNELEKAVKRAPAGLRMQLLDHLGDPDLKRLRTERLRLLEAHLDDTDVEVRNTAALGLESMLGIASRFRERSEDEPGRTPMEWAKLRSQIREALKKEFAGQHAK